MPDISIGRFRGGFCVTWHDPDTGSRRRHQLKAGTRAEAQAEAIDTYRKHTPAQRACTVADIWAEYVADLGTKPTAETMGYTGKAVLPFFGAYRPDQIDRSMCRAYAAARLADGKKPGTPHTELGHLRSALKFGEKIRLIDRAPYIWIPEKPTPKERFLTEKEIHALLDATAAPHIQLAVHLMLATAARVGAILDLTWDRVDFEQNQINLRLPDAVTRKGRAVVPINAGLRAALSIAKEAALSDFVVEYAGAQVGCIRKGFTNALDRAGIKDVTIHTLRHSAAVHMVAAGIPLEMVGQFMGHSNVATTYKVYARFAPSHMDAAARVIDFVQIKLVKG